LTFKVSGDIYTGTVNGKKIEGNVTSVGKTSKWSATR
jgi:hypothetical protein